MARIVYQDKEGREYFFDLPEEGVVQIGRISTVDIVIPEASVSRKHAQLDISPGKWLLNDLGSKNGVEVNGKRTVSALLKHGDRVVFGSAVCFFQEYATEEQTREEESKIVESIKLGSEQDPTSSLGLTGKQIGSTMVYRGGIGATKEKVDFGELQKSHQYLLFLYEMSKLLAPVVKTEELLDRLLTEVLKIVDADSGVILVRDENSGELVPSVSMVKETSIIRRGELPKISRMIVNRSLQNEEAILSHDAAVDPRFQGSESIIRHHIHSSLCVPLRCQKKAIGVIYLHRSRTSGHFMQDDLNLLAVISHEAAMAIENARLVEANIKSEYLARVGETVAGLAHCVKNILNALQGGAYIVDQALEKNDEATIKKGWGIVRRNSGRMSDLVLDMLSLAKRREPEYKECDINEVVKEVSDLLRAKAEEKGVKINVATYKELGMVRVDPRGVYRCLVNLVSNAIDAIEEGEGKIEVKSLPGKKSDFLLQVSDNGCGIPPEQLKKLFTAFHSTKGSRGTGLGLAVTHKVVEEHGGSMSVESEVGKGTCFTIRLPRQVTATGQYKN